MFWNDPDTATDAGTGAGSGRERTAATGPEDARAAAIRAIDAAPLAIFAYRDRRGRPAAWPVTPVVAGDRAVVSSTLAFARKAEHVRRDPRVALLAGGSHVAGRASVRADVTGDEFVARFLEQEARKYTPTADLVRIPLHRRLFSWYFGRVLIEITASVVREVSGADHATLITLDATGHPRITPVEWPRFPADGRDDGIDARIAVGERLDLLSPDGAPLPFLADGPAQVLVHVEPGPTDLRQLRIDGEFSMGSFRIRNRTGSLLPPPGGTGVRAELIRQIDYRRRARQARRRIATWTG